MADKTALTVHCQCKNNEYKFTVARTSLPLPGHHCLCNRCRHVTGVLFPSFVELPNDVEPPFDPSAHPKTLSVYKSSEVISRFFCSKCGSHILLYVQAPYPHWTICNGSLDSVNGLVKYTDHRRLEDCIDDELDISSIVDDGLPRYRLDKDSEDELMTQDALDEFHKSSGGVTIPSYKKQDDTIAFSCKCGGVSGLLMRPDAMQHEWVDDEKYHWCTADKKRWRVMHCTCSDCRLASGGPNISYVVPPIAHVKWTGETSLVTWRSSPEVQRSFCGTCGATVLYERDDRKGIYHLAAALLVTGGSKPQQKALDWLFWGPGVDPAKGYDEEFGTALQIGNRKWHNKRREVLEQETQGLSVFKLL